MKKYFPIFALFFSLLILSPLNCLAVSPDLVINEIMFNPSGADAGNEWVELIAVDDLNINGYTLTDNDGNTYTFPNISVESGEIVVVHFAAGVDDTTGPVYHLYTGTASEWLNNTGDDLEIRDNGGPPQEFAAYGSGGEVDPAPGGATAAWSGNIDIAVVDEGHTIGLNQDGDDQDGGSNWEEVTSPNEGSPNKTPEITIEKSGAAQIHLGDAAGEEYVITITNIGDGPAYGVSVQDDYPGNDPDFFSVDSVNSVLLNGVGVGYTTSDDTDVYTFSDLPTIMPGDVLEIRLQLAAGCDAAHGFNSNEGLVDYYEIPEGGAAAPTLDDNFDTEVLFGILDSILEATHINGVALATPTSNPDAKVGDVITYRGVLQNGFDGDLYDVVSSVSWGTELTYVAGTLNDGANMTCTDGTGISCNSVTIPANTTDATFSFTFDLEANGCVDIDATIEAQESCNPSDTLSGSVYLDLGNPNISYTISSMDIPYGGSVPVTIDITNSGKGPAREFTLDTSFEGKCVSITNLAAGWTYGTAPSIEDPPGPDREAVFSYSGVIDEADDGVDPPENDNVQLTFDLATCGDCNDRTPGGQIIFEPAYKNDCNELFISPKAVDSFSTVNAPTVSLEKTASTTTINVGDQIDYTLTLRVSDNDDINGDIVITDIFQGEQALVAGSINQSLGTTSSSSNQIVWTVGTTSAPSADGATLTFSTEVDDPCVQGQTTENNANFTATDSENCTLTGSAGSGTIYINNNSGGGTVTTDKTVSGNLPVCDAAGVTVTNEFQIDTGVTGQWDSGTGTSSFTDELAAGSLCYMSGTAEYLFDSDDTAGTNFGSWTAVPAGNITYSNGASLQIDLEFLNGVDQANGNDTNVGGNDLQIRYQVYACEGVSGTRDAISTLRIDGNAGSCGSGGEYDQHGLITVEDVQVGMTIQLLDFATSSPTEVVESCGANKVRINVSNSSGDYTDLIVNFPTDNYTYIGNPVYTGFSDGSNNVTPNVTVGNPVVFSFDITGNADLLTTGGTITFDVQKNCDQTPSGVSATGTYYTPEDTSAPCCTGNTCGGTQGSLSASDTPLFENKGLLEIKATPDPYPIDTTSLKWTLYVYNRGDGTAYNVNVNDVFGPSLDFISSTVDGVLTVPASTPGPGDSTTYDWNLGDMVPNQTIEIEITAEMNGYSCAPADASSTTTITWGCGGNTCQTLNAGAIPTFSFLESEASAYNVFPQYVNLCEQAEIVFRIKNINKADVYGAELIQDLENSGMTFVAGSARISTDPAAQNNPSHASWVPVANPLDPGPDPNNVNYTAIDASTTRLGWQGYDNTLSNYIPELEVMESAENVLIYFRAETACTTPEDPQMHVEATYQKFCDFGSNRRNVLIQDQQSIPYNAPEIEIIKEARKVTIPESSFATTNVYAGQGDEVEYRITITNNSSHATAQNVTLTDALPANLTYSSIIKQDGEVAGNPAGSGPDWVLESVGPNDTDRYIILATVNNCVPEVTNTADVTLGCDSNGCTFAPSLGYDSQDIHGNLVTGVSASTSAAVGASGFNTCGGEISITVSNEGAKSGNVIVAPALPAGWVFDASGGDSVTFSPNTGQSCTGGCPDFAGGDLHNPEWTIDALDRNEEVTITFYVKADGTYCDTDISNPDSNCPPRPVNIPIEINMMDTCGNNNIINDTLSLTPDCPDVDISISPSEQLVDEGGTATFTVRLDNKGNTLANNLRLEMFLGNGYTVTAPASGSDITVNNGADPRTIVWENNAINSGNGIVSGGFWETTVTATVNSGDLTVDGTISGFCHDFAGTEVCRYSWDEVPADATPSVVAVSHEKLITHIDPIPALTFTNPQTVADAALGNAVVFDINVRVIGNGDYENFMIRDVLNENFDFIRAELDGNNDNTFVPIPDNGNCSSDGSIQTFYTLSGTTRSFYITNACPPAPVPSFNVSGGTQDISIRITARLRNDATALDQIGLQGNNTSYVTFTYDNGNRSAVYDDADDPDPKILTKETTVNFWGPELTPTKSYPGWGTTYSASNPMEVVVGDTIEYTLSFLNESTADPSYMSPAYDVVVTDEIPFGMRSVPPSVTSVFIDTNGNNTLDGADRELTLNTHYEVDPGFGAPDYELIVRILYPGIADSTTHIARGESLVVKYTATVDSNSGAGLALENRTYADYTSLYETSNTDPGDDDQDGSWRSDEDTTVLATGDTTMTKISTLDGAFVQEADQIIYTLTFPNPVQGVYLYGDDDTSDPPAGTPEFYDTLPDGLEIMNVGVSINPTRACELVFGTIVPPYSGGTGSCAEDDRDFEISASPVGAGTRDRTVNIQFNKLYPGDYMVITIKAKVHYSFDDGSLIPDQHVLENQGHIEVYTKPSTETGRTSNTYDSEIVTSIYEKLISITPDHSGQTTPGNWVSYDHIVSNQTSSTEIVCFSTASSQGWEWIVYDDAGNILTDDTTKNALTVAGNDSVTITIKYFVPIDTPDGTVDKTTVLMHPHDGTCDDAQVLDDVVDTTVVLLTQLELVKWVRQCHDIDFVIACGDPNFVETNEAYPCDYLEYKIEFTNTSTQTYYTLNLNDGVPNHTDLTPNAYGANQDILLHRPDDTEVYLNVTDTASELLLDLSSEIPQLNPGDKGWIQYKVRVKGKNCP